MSAPDLVRLLYSKLTGQVIRDVWSFNRCLPVCMRTRLLAGQPQPTHQTEYLKASDVHTVFFQHTGESAAARRASTFDEQPVNLGSQSQSLSIDGVAPLANKG